MSTVPAKLPALVGFGLYMPLVGVPSFFWQLASLKPVAACNRCTLHGRGCSKGRGRGGGGGGGGGGRGGEWFTQGVCVCVWGGGGGGGGGKGACSYFHLHIYDN